MRRHRCTMKFQLISSTLKLLCIVAILRSLSEMVRLPRQFGYFNDRYVEQTSASNSSSAKSRSALEPVQGYAASAAARGGASNNTMMPQSGPSVINGTSGASGVTLIVSSPSDYTPQRIPPRVVALEYTNSTLTGTSSIRGSNNTGDIFKLVKHSITRGGIHQRLNWMNRNALSQTGDHKCEPMYDWQLTSYPSCNRFHELGSPNPNSVRTGRTRVINTGGVRIAFEMHEQVDGKEMKFVFKTLKYDRPLNANYLEQQRRDGLAFEKMSQSKFIPDLYGFCGTGTMMDFMPDGSMHDYFKGSRIAGGSTLPPVDLLRLGIHVASGIADLHTIDGTETPSYFHNDLKGHQFLYQDGLFKLNDFHSARPIWAITNTTLTCRLKGFGIPVLSKHRSLEEHKRELKHPDYVAFDPDKLDVWMGGNILYTILTDLYIFEKPFLNISEVSMELIAGRRSPYPENIMNSNDPSHVALRTAIEMCWVQNWEERPSARSIATYMMKQLNEITGDADPDLTVTLPERDKDQKLTSSDFNKFNYVSKTAKKELAGAANLTVTLPERDKGQKSTSSDFNSTNHVSKASKRELAQAAKQMQNASSVSE